MSKKEKISEEKRAVNGPFELTALEGETRYGLSGGVIRKPLAVQVTGSDGLPPRDNKNESVLLSLRFEVLKVPKNSEVNLISGTQERMTIKTDAYGRASISAQLGQILGVYLFKASLIKFEDSNTLIFRSLTNGVTSQIIRLNHREGTVGRPMRFRLRAIDWLGNNVNNAKIEARIIPTFQSESIKTVEAKFLRNGTYNVVISSNISGSQEMEITDAVSGTRISSRIDVSPGSVARLDFLSVENPRQTAPYDQVLMEVVAIDRFGNFVPNIKVEWKKTSGTILKVPPKENVSAAAHFKFGRADEVKLVANYGSKRRTLKLTLPGVYFRFAEKEDFTFTGSPFKVCVDVFPPAGGGKLHSVFVAFKEPDTAKRVDNAPSNTENGIAPPEIITHANGTTDICIEGMDLELPEEQIPYTIAELTYDCFINEEACFQVLKATAVISNSPPREVTLHPGVKWCRPQKLRTPKTLCINICIANKVGGKTLAQLKAEAKAQVERTQAIFNENISKCCPKIVMKPCYNEIPWADYQRIIGGGEVNNVLEQFDYTTPKSNDKTKDTFKLSDEVKNLLKKCRKKDCVSIYYVPDHRFKSGTTWGKSNGCGVSPNDFPETTAAKGSGTGIIMSQGLNIDDHTLVHELGHILIDNPRDVNGGVEHVANSNADRVMKVYAPAGRKLTKEECSSIFANIGKYGGKCD